MKQIDDILKLYGNNFVHHVEKALNSKYNSIDNTSLNEDDVISLPEIVVNIWLILLIFILFSRWWRWLIKEMLTLWKGEDPKFLKLKVYPLLFASSSSWSVTSTLHSLRFWTLPPPFSSFTKAIVSFHTPKGIPCAAFHKEPLHMQKYLMRNYTHWTQGLQCSCKVVSPDWISSRLTVCLIKVWLPLFDGKAKISKFAMTFLDQNILTFYVTMDNFGIPKLFQSQCYLPSELNDY